MIVRDDRLLAIALFAAYLTSLAAVAQRLGTPYWQGTLAGLIALSSRYSWGKLVWITDAIHTFTGLLVVIALALLLSSLPRLSVRRLVASLAVAALALLRREDALAMYPLLPTFAVVYTLREAMRARPEPIATSTAGALSGRVKYVLALLPAYPTASRLRMISVHTAALLFMTVAVSFVRAVLVEGAPSTIQIEGWFRLLPYVFFPLGPDEHAIPWIGALGALLAIIFLVVPHPGRREALLWLAAAVATTAPALVVARPNLLLYPTSLFSFFLARTLGESGRRSLVTGALSALILIPLIMVSATLNIRSQESLHPMSSNYLEENAKFIWGPTLFSPATWPSAP